MGVYLPVCRCAVPNPELPQQLITGLHLLPGAWRMETWGVEVWWQDLQLRAWCMASGSWYGWPVAPI